MKTPKQHTDDGVPKKETPGQAGATGPAAPVETTTVSPSPFAGQEYSVPAGQPFPRPLLDLAGAGQAGAGHGASSPEALVSEATNPNLLTSPLASPPDGQDSPPASPVRLPSLDKTLPMVTLPSMLPESSAPSPGTGDGRPAGRGAWPAPGFSRGGGGSESESPSASAEDASTAASPGEESLPTSALPGQPARLRRRRAASTRITTGQSSLPSESSAVSESEVDVEFPADTMDVADSDLDLDDDYVPGPPKTAWIVLGGGILTALFGAGFILFEDIKGLFDDLDAHVTPKLSAYASPEKVMAAFGWSEEDAERPAEPDDADDMDRRTESSAATVEREAHPPVATGDLGFDSEPTAEPDMATSDPYAATEASSPADDPWPSHAAYHRGPQPAMSDKSAALRKKLRRQLVSACKAGKHKEAVNHGRRLDAAFGLDWEAEYTFAQCLRSARYRREAFRRLESFVMKYPQNVYADDALFWMGNVLRNIGQQRDAREYFRRVASDPTSDWRERARQWLRRLGNKPKAAPARKDARRRPTSKRKAARARRSATASVR